MLGELLGVPAAEGAEFRAWTTAALTPAYVQGRPMSLQDGGRRQHDYVEDLISRRQPARGERRDAGEHLAFGRGIHASIGSSIARLEGAIAIRTVLRRFPRIALACAPGELRWRPSPAFRGLDALPVISTG